MTEMVGTFWRHRKRGTTYRVLMDYGFEFHGLADGDDAFVVLNSSGGKITKEVPEHEMWDVCMMLPVSVQISRPVPTEPSYATWIVYQAVGGMLEGDIYARPAGEFIDGRFQQITQEEARS